MQEIGSACREATDAGEQVRCALALHAQALADIEPVAEARVRQAHVVPLEQEALDLRALERLVRRHMRAGTFHPADERLFGAVLGSIDRTRREHPLPATEEPKETT
jgi:hypothetical protein